MKKSYSVACAAALTLAAFFFSPSYGQAPRQAVQSIKGVDGTAVDFNIVIDAAKDEWYKTLTGPDDGYIYLPYDMIYLIIPNPPADNTDLSAFCWLAWDDAYLYFYSEVTDDIILVNNATNYENDGIELKIDPDPTQATTAGVAAVRMTALGADEADNPAGVDNIGLTELDVPFDIVEGVDYARKLTDTGYNVEFRVPWTSIVRAEKSVAVGVGNIFGLAINVLENDETRWETGLQWSAGMDDLVWSNPQLHGTVTFLADHKFKMEAINSAGGDAANPNPEKYIPPSTDVSSRSVDVVRTFGLAQNYPNPFNPATKISYTLPKSCEVTLAVYSISGRCVSTLAAGRQAAGLYNAVWNASGFPSGVYILRLNAGEFTSSKKMIVSK